MNHDLAFTRNRLLGLALQFERGEMDREFAAAEMPVAEMRAAVVQRIRQLADAIEGAEG